MPFRRCSISRTCLRIQAQLKPDNIDCLNSRGETSHYSPVAYLHKRYAHCSILNVNHGASFCEPVRPCMHPRPKRCTACVPEVCRERKPTSCESINVCIQKQLRARWACASDNRYHRVSIIGVGVWDELALLRELRDNVVHAVRFPAQLPGIVVH
jgi:hypothetical protein